MNVCCLTCVWNPSCGGRKAEWVFSEVEVDEVLGDKCTVHVFWFCLDEHKRRTDSNVSSQWLAFVRWKYFWPCSNKLSSEQEFRVAALLVRSIVREFCCPSFYTLGYIQRWRCRKQAVRLSIKYSLWISSTHLDHVPAQAFDMMACDGCIVPYVLAPHIGIIRPTKAFVKPEVWKLEVRKYWRVFRQLTWMSFSSFILALNLDALSPFCCDHIPFFFFCAISWSCRYLSFPFGPYTAPDPK